MPGKKQAYRFFLSAVALTFVFGAVGLVSDREFIVQSVKLRIDPEAEDAQIRKTVGLYNKIFSDLHAIDGLPLTLNEFPASKQLRHELYKSLGYLRSGRLILVYDMASIEFVKIKRTSPYLAEATVFEEWNYIYQDAQTRQTARSIKGMGQGFKYLLAKTPEGWIVRDYFPSDVTVEKKKNEFLF